MMFNNLLKVASSVIPQQTVYWLRHVSRETDARGRFVNVYDDPVPVRGSLQSVDARDVKEMGFDTSKTYKTFYTSENMQNVQRGEAPDRIMYNGETFDIEGDADWYAQDGWKSVYCVKVDPL